MKEVHNANYDRGMLVLRLQLIKMRTDYLNQLNTQATLLASCAVTMLGSGNINLLWNVFTDGLAHTFDEMFRTGTEAVYILATCTCFASCELGSCLRPRSRVEPSKPLASLVASL